MFDQKNWEVKPWHLLNDENYTQQEIRDKRFDICKQCDEFVSISTTCKKCFCFMAAKTWLKQAECPLKKWGASEV